MSRNFELLQQLQVDVDAQSFPEDLVLTETRDRQNFQGRYVLNHPFKGSTSCEAGARYRAERCFFTPADPVLVSLKTLQHWLWQRLQAPAGSEVSA